MKTQQQVLEAIKDKTFPRDGGLGSFGDRDYDRLVNYYPESEIGTFGFKLSEGANAPGVGPWKVEEWTEENIVNQLKIDVAFGHEKAVDERGISSSLMYGVVNMWLWILEDGLYEEPGQDFDNYARDFFAEVAEKYVVELT